MIMQTPSMVKQTTDVSCSAVNIILCFFELQIETI